jgi:hypothetical protein
MLIFISILINIAWTGICGTALVAVINYVGKTLDSDAKTYAYCFMAGFICAMVIAILTPIKDHLLMAAI